MKFGFSFCGCADILIRFLCLFMLVLYLFLFLFLVLFLPALSFPVQLNNFFFFWLFYTSLLAPVVLFSLITLSGRKFLLSLPLLGSVLCIFRIFILRLEDAPLFVLVVRG